MRNRRRERVVSPEDMIGWIWENDDPAAATCESQHLDISDQTVEVTELQVYYGLLACGQGKKDGSTESGVGNLDRTLTNILVFADDCQAAAEWLSSESVNYADEQGRRRGERRRHLKERGLLQNGVRFVRLCGQAIIGTDTIAMMAARQCINDWEESAEQQSLHFKREEAGVRWEPCSTENGRTATLHLGNPYTAPPATEEADGRTVQEYRIELWSDENPIAGRSAWTSAEESDTEDEDETELAWTLNGRSEAAMEWLTFAAETVGDITRESDKDTVEELFPSLQEIRREAGRTAAQKRAAQTTKTQPTAGPATRKSGHTIH